MEQDYESESANSDEQAVLQTEKRIVNIDIYDKEGMEKKLAEIQSDFVKNFRGENIKWNERLQVVSERGVEFVEADQINDDIQREVEFYNIANENALKALKQINQENIRLDRPTDFYAEMFKSDDVMTKIRSTLVKQQVRMKNFEEVKLRKQMKRIQKQKKFEKHENKVEEKKRNTSAINKWKEDLHKRRGDTKDLDQYVSDEKKGKGGVKMNGKKLGKFSGGKPDEKFKNMKSKKMQKGKRLGKVARIKKRGTSGGKKQQRK